MRKELLRIMRTMAKRLVVVLIAVLCSFCFLAGCKPKPEPGLNKVLAIGMETLPEKVKYEVGQYVDPTGGKVAVIYAEDPDEKVIIDLTEEMLNKNSYDINTVGKKLVVKSLKLLQKMKIVKNYDKQY